MNQKTIPNKIPIIDFQAPELDVYARMNEIQLLNRHEPEKGMFIAESPKVIERALDGGYQPVSFLVQHKELEKEGKVFIIAPEDTYGVGRAERNMDKLEQLYDQGYNETRLLLPELKEYLEA